MIDLKNIHSLTDFKRNAKDFVEQVKATKLPLVLTVNGKAEVVVQDAETFQAMTERIQQAEEELQTLKLEALKGELSIGINQVKNGAYADYDDNSLPILLEDIKARGRKRLGQNSST
jgi:prevent-host-death family protein